MFVFKLHVQSQLTIQHLGRKLYCNYVTPYRTRYTTGVIPATGYWHICQRFSRIVTSSHPQACFSYLDTAGETANV